MICGCKFRRSRLKSVCYRLNATVGLCTHRHTPTHAGQNSKPDPLTHREKSDSPVRDVYNGQSLVNEHAFVFDISTRPVCMMHSKQFTPNNRRMAMRSAPRQGRSDPSSHALQHALTHPVRDVAIYHHSDESTACQRVDSHVHTLTTHTLHIPSCSLQQFSTHLFGTAWCTQTAEDSAHLCKRKRKI